MAVAVGVPGRVDDPAPSGEPVELRMGVPAGHRLDIGTEPGPDGVTVFHRAVDQQHFVVAAGWTMTEPADTKAIDLQSHSRA